VKKSARAKDRTPTRTSTRTPHPSPEDKSASRARSTCHHPLEPTPHARRVRNPFELTVTIKTEPEPSLAYLALMRRLLAPPKNLATGGGTRV